MEYRQVSPPTDLAPWVECIWILRGMLASEGQAILPDGRLELVFHFDDPPLASQTQQPATLIAGRMMQALALESVSRMDALGVRLRPEAAGCLVPCHVLAPVESMDAVLGAWARRVRERLGNAGDMTARVELTWKLLRRWIRGRSLPDAAVCHSVRLIEIARGRGPMDAFVPQGIGIRQWQRRFIRSSGFAPKAFARITRFQHFVGLVQSGQGRSQADLALEAGFYDQAHLSNECRALSGHSPESFIHSGRGMPEFYRDVFFQDGGTRGK